jgi:PIN domain nuclease of toxin-antitoxin system
VSSVLIDTHVALWALGEPHRLSTAERAVLVDTGIERCLSPVSVWEAAIKREKGKLRAPRGLAAALAAEFRLLDLDASLLEMAAELPPHHSDPFDRVLIAHAVRDGMPIMTRDRAFAAYGITFAV